MSKPKGKSSPNRLREMRSGGGLTQKALARVSGVSEFTISRIETGRNVPHFPTKKALADALGVPMSDVFEAAS